jgi:hypothetical protein
VHSTRPVTSPHSRRTTLTLPHSGNSHFPAVPLQSTLQQLHWLYTQGTVHPRTGREGPEGEYMYSSTLSSTSALQGDGWSTPHRAGSGTPGTGSWVVPGPVWTVRKISTPPGFDSRTVQPGASRYTDWAIPVTYTFFHIYVYVYMYVCTYKVVQLKAKLQHTGTRSVVPLPVLSPRNSSATFV